MQCNSSCFIHFGRICCYEAMQSCLVVFIAITIIIIWRELITYERITAKKGNPNWLNEFLNANLFGGTSSCAYKSRKLHSPIIRNETGTKKRERVPPLHCTDITFALVFSFFFFSLSTRRKSLNYIAFFPFCKIKSSRNISEANTNEI